MNLSEFLPAENERPLDRLPADGGFTGIFRTIACIGDSLSSGEFEGLTEDGHPSYHDMFDYSWGQFMARAAGIRVHNFSQGGMTAHYYMAEFAEERGFWSKDLLARAYIIALGVNDLNFNDVKSYIGTVADIDLSDYRNNAHSFAGYYGAIIQRYREMQPDSPFFLVTMAKEGWEPIDVKARAQRELLYQIAELFENTYVIDLYEYGPVYDADFKRNFYLRGHLNPAGYKLTARMIMAYIDYIVRHNLPHFKQAGFIGTPLYRHDEQ